MELIINGDKREIKANTVLDLLYELALNPLITVVEKNGDIVDRDHYVEESVIEGDVLELIRFMGGGSERAVRPVR